MQAAQIVLYLHGFRSTPMSAKCVMLKQTLKDERVHFISPDLNASPFEVMRQLCPLVEGLDAKKLVIVGSSLGGFYATYLAEKVGARAVLLNPAMTPWNVVKDYLGEQIIYGTDRTLLVEPHYVDELKSLEVQPKRAADQTLLILSAHDEVLDWRQAYRQWKGSEIILSEGDNHGIQAFSRFCPQIKKFIIGS